MVRDSRWTAGLYELLAPLPGDYPGDFQHQALRLRWLPAYWGYNRESLIGYLEHALTGFYGTVTNPDGQPLDATITIPSHDRDRLACGYKP